MHRWSVPGLLLVLTILLVQVETGTKALVLPQAPPAPGAEAAIEDRQPDVIYVPTPPDVVRVMLETAEVTAEDVVYDLGCGDGRIVVAAARDFGARGVGIDIDPERIKEANENVEADGVGDRVRIVHGDLFSADISEATVVTLYLLPDLNVKLMPKLRSELAPGTRIVSHSFDMRGEWEPEKEIDVDGRKVYFWTVPPH